MWWFLGLLFLSNNAQGYSGTSSDSRVPESASRGSNGGDNVKYYWSAVEFHYNKPSRREDEILSRQYIPEDITLLDVDAYTGRNGKRREFVTTPSLLPGTPFTLNEVTSKKGQHGHVLRPFPNEHMHYKGDCHSIISPFRIKIDKKGRMFVLDTGKTDVFVAPKKVCEPQILVFDLNNNDTLIKRYRIPADQLDPKSLLVNLEVEVQNDDTYVYMADPVGIRVIVYSMQKDISYAITHPYFYPDPSYGFYELNGVNFTLMDGILSLALARTKKPDDMKLYFHSLSAGREGMVHTHLLKDPNLAKAEAYQFRLSDWHRGTHASVEVVTNRGILIFANLEDNALYAWDTNTAYSPKNFRVLARNANTLQFVSGMKLVDNDLYVLSSRLQNPIAGALARGEVNYRILVFNVDKLLSRQQGVF